MAPQDSLDFEDELVAVQQFLQEKYLYGVGEARRRLMEKLPAITDPAEEARRIEAEKFEHDPDHTDKVSLLERADYIVEVCRANATSKRMGNDDPDAGVARSVYQSHAVDFDWEEAAQVIEQLLSENRQIRADAEAMRAGVEEVSLWMAYTDEAVERAEAAEAHVREIAKDLDRISAEREAYREGLMDLVYAIDQRGGMRGTTPALDRARRILAENDR